MPDVNTSRSSRDCVMNLRNGDSDLVEERCRRMLVAAPPPGGRLKSAGSSRRTRPAKPNGGSCSPLSASSSGSTSGHSSVSSLHRGGNAVVRRRVCISDVVVVAVPGLSCEAVRRPSLVQSSERQARKVRFFINSDKFFRGAVVAVSGKKFRTFDRLLEHLSCVVMRNQVTLPNGVRFVFALDGRPVEQVEGLRHGENYVCSSVSQFRRMDYLKMIHDDRRHQSWKGMKRDACCLGGGRQNAYKASGHSKSFGVSKDDREEAKFKPKIIAVLRSGLRPRKAFRVLLNGRNTMSLDVVLAELTAAVKLDSGAVRKVFSLLDGKPVVGVADFAESEVFVAYGVEKCSTDDFDLDLLEFRSVQSILKSPDLDARYVKFACPPKAGSVKKFSLVRNLPKKRRESKAGGSQNNNNNTPRSDSSSSCGNNANSEDLPDAAVPPEIASKYVVGKVIGDGNFAVVRRCVSRRTKRAFALKVIDKSKCRGKEHMIESEIAILNLASHPHIIELVETFDTAGEKFLVTELVAGGDLFDSIAADAKYGEAVSRRMIGDLASALQYLHDKMIVHRDIKPENLLVVRAGPDEGVTSLKLGDFGLAQLVSEPLYTVCGTPTYVAPEILAETGYGVKVDVWAAGVIAYILLVGYPPFSSRTNNQEELFDQILSGLFEFNSPDWDDVSHPAKELISLTLQVDPLQRYSAYEILQHPWIKAN